MFVLTIDQRDSRHHRDRVPILLGLLNDDVVASRLLLPFERTVGDELQAISEDPQAVVRCAELVIRQGDWYLGVGVGGVESPLPASSREGRGAAYIAAREAVEQAKRSDPPVILRSVADVSIAEKAAGKNAVVLEAEALLRLLVVLWQRRTEAGWQAVEAMRTGEFEHQHHAASALGISAQAFSRRLQVAYWDLEREVIPLLLRLLSEANTISEPAPQLSASKES